MGKMGQGRLIAFDSGTFYEFVGETNAVTPTNLRIGDRINRIPEERRAQEKLERSIFMQGFYLDAGRVYVLPPTAMITRKSACYDFYQRNKPA
jgi:hypothetical protein